MNAFGLSFASVLAFHWPFYAVSLSADTVADLFKDFLEDVFYRYGCLSQLESRMN